MTVLSVVGKMADSLRKYQHLTVRNVLRYVQLYSFLEYSKNVLIFTNLPVYPSPQTKPSTLHIFLPEML